MELVEPRDRAAPVAYFSMDIGLESAIPTYSGGLGVLAGDTLRAAADLELPMVAVSLVHRHGYVTQRLDATGNQAEEPAIWHPEQRLELAPARVHVTVEGRRVHVRAWLYRVRGHSGFEVPVYLLDSDVPENAPEDRHLTDQLYGGDQRYRLAQEVLLGIGGVRLLRALGHRELRAFHMNEGHAALLTLGLLEDLLGERELGDAHDDEVTAVRRQCIFTTHTPVEAGHDRFAWDLAWQVLGDRYVPVLQERGWAGEESLNMTQLALSLSRQANAVSARHAEVSRTMFPGRRIHAITNGVHAATWTSEPFRDLFDRHIGEWRRTPFALRHGVRLPPEEVAEAHRRAKLNLTRIVEERTGTRLVPEALTLGFARRSTSYKRADLVFEDPEQLLRLASEVGPLQLVFAGKAHPRDEAGKALIRRIFDVGATLGDRLRVVYLENHDMELGRDICAGVDVWLNTPVPPLEASGTSGMKAALNGVPSLSVLDGWWVEGHLDGRTGWAISRDGEGADDPGDHASALYERLEHDVMPLFYGDRDGWNRVMRTTIAINASYFNAQRMVLEYDEQAYRG